MRRKAALIVGLCALLAAAVPVAGCGEEEGQDALESVEGEPLHLGELIYNVAITRFLNPNDLEDAEYLAGQPPDPAGQSYLAVFLTIKNENEDESLPSASSYVVTDASDRHYEPVETENPYALDIGASVPADGELPLDDTTAATGVIEGSMLLFLVDDDVAEERPLELEVESSEATGIVELDI